jgi:hypothetical protein
MRIAVIACSVLLVLGSGCIHKKTKLPPGKYSSVPGVADTAAAPQNSTQQTPQGKQQVTMAPENVLVGKVKRVNPTARFVVLSFPVGRLPAPDEPFSVYRRGLKVGEIKITNQQLNEYIVADIIEGDAEEGDEVRNK